MEPVILRMSGKSRMALNNVWATPHVSKWIVEYTDAFISVGGSRDSYYRDPTLDESWNHPRWAFSPFVNQLIPILAFEGEDVDILHARSRT